MKVSSTNHHVFLVRGKKGAGFADIILGAKDNTGTGDDGVIMRDPDYPGSDIYLISHDAVFIDLDNDDNETVDFYIRAGDDEDLFRVNESGTVYVKNSSVHGSDRNRKENITNLNYSKILQAVTDMPIYE